MYSTTYGDKSFIGSVLYKKKKKMFPVTINHYDNLYYYYTILYILNNVHNVYVQ